MSTIILVISLIGLGFYIGLVLTRKAVRLTNSTNLRIKQQIDSLHK